MTTAPVRSRPSSNGANSVISLVLHLTLRQHHRVGVIDGG